MQLIVNGEKQIYDISLNISELLTKLAIDTRKIAVERNLQIVPKSCYGSQNLQDGDIIEIVAFIGGG